MDIGSILLILSVAIICGVMISRPFVLGEQADEALNANDDLQSLEHKRSTLLADQERMITSLRDLEFDHKMEKIPEVDYPVQRQALLKSGAAIMRQLDEMNAVYLGKTVEAEDQEIASLNNNEDTLESLIAERRRNRLEKSNGFCPQCGKPTQKSDRYCPHCGTQLKED